MQHPPPARFCSFFSGIKRGLSGLWFPHPGHATIHINHRAQSLHILNLTSTLILSFPPATTAGDGRVIPFPLALAGRGWR